MPDTSDELGTNLFEEQPVAPTRKPAAKISKKNDNSSRTWIVLEESPDVPPTGLSLGVNGDVAMLLPGEPVHLQNKYIEVLNHALTSVAQVNSQQQVVGHRQRHRFPYRAATPAEIEAATDKS